MAGLVLGFEQPPLANEDERQPRRLEINAQRFGQCWVGGQHKDGLAVERLGLLVAAASLQHAGLSVRHGGVPRGDPLRSVAGPVPRLAHDLLCLTRRLLRRLEIAGDGMDARQRGVIVDLPALHARPAQVERVAAKVACAIEIAAVEVGVAQIGQDVHSARVARGARQVFELLSEPPELARGEATLVIEVGQPLGIAGGRRLRIDEGLRPGDGVRIDAFLLIQDGRDVVDRPRRRHERAARESRRHPLGLVDGHRPLTGAGDEREREAGEETRGLHRRHPPRYRGRSSRTCWTETAK